MSLPSEVATVSEESFATWDKRFKQAHYSYRDAHQVTLIPVSEVQMLGMIAQALGATPPTVPALVYYVFGTNARLTINPLTATFAPYGNSAWPMGVWSATCYARLVLLHCTQNAFIKMVSLNPNYVAQIIRQVATGVLATEPPLIFEAEQPILGGNYYWFFPTYGYALTFRAPVGGPAGTLRIYVEGNVEGGE